jgi:tetratricopeptide (TPR) repeat protein
MRTIASTIILSTSFSNYPSFAKDGNTDMSQIVHKVKQSQINTYLASSSMPLGSADSDLSKNDIENVQKAFRDFDSKQLDAADIEFTVAIAKWKSLNRPRDEVVSLIKARANVRLDNKKFESSLSDYNEAIEMMRSDGEDAQGIAKYPEYPDTFVGRGGAKEGFADWDGALQDYNKAINLWGGGRGEGVNPYVLTYRGNVLCRLGKYREAIDDYEAASNRFIGMRDIPRYSDSRANLALALYEVGQTTDSIKVNLSLIALFLISLSCAVYRRL